MTTIPSTVEIDLDVPTGGEVVLFRHHENRVRFMVLKAESVSGLWVGECGYVSVHSLEIAEEELMTWCDQLIAKPFKSEISAREYARAKRVGRDGEVETQPTGGLVSVTLHAYTNTDANALLVVIEQMIRLLPPPKPPRPRP